METDSTSLHRVVKQYFGNKLGIEGNFLQLIMEIYEKSTASIMQWRRKWQPTPAFLPVESCGRRSLVGCCLQGRTELDMTEVTQQQQHQQQHHVGKLKAFLSKTKTETEKSTLSASISTVLEDLTRALRQEKEIKHTQIEKVNISLS